jgi:ParB family chromosome partitioning protein
MNRSANIKPLETRMSPEKKQKRSALGMGLDALIPDDLQGEFFLCPIEEIHPSDSQPRKVFDEGSIMELADSIRAKGLIQPVVVRRLPAGMGYELIAGERRWRAAQRAGLLDLPAIVREAEADEVLELALVENLQREDLNPVDEARAYKLLLDSSGMTQEQVAERIGKSRVAVANALRLLGLSTEALEMLKNGEVTAGHARAVLAAPQARRLHLLHVIAEKGLSVREAEALVKKPAKAKAAPAKVDPDVRALEERISRALGTRVGLKAGRKKGSGQITISFDSYDDLDRILLLLDK